MSLELAIVVPKVPSSSDTTTDSTQELPRAALHALVDSRPYILHYPVIRQITQDFCEGSSQGGSEYPPSFSLCFDDVTMKVYTVQEQGLSHQAAADKLQQTVGMLVQHLQEDTPPSKAVETEIQASAQETGHALSGEAEAVLWQKTGAWVNHMDNVLGLSMALQRGSEVQPPHRGKHC